MRSLIACTLLLCSVAAGSAQDAALRGSQIRKAFAGHTIVGTADGERYAETLRPDGSLVGRSDRDGEYEGEWSVKGDRLCFSYENEEDDCSRVSLRGTKITFLGDGEDDTYATLK